VKEIVELEEVGHESIQKLSPVSIKISSEVGSALIGTESTPPLTVAGEAAEFLSR
jgi:hypothetical protein